MARFQQRVTSFDLEQLRRAYERHLGLFMVSGLNRRENRSWTLPDSAPVEPYDHNPVIEGFLEPFSGFPEDLSGSTSSGGS